MFSRERQSSVYYTVIMYVVKILYTQGVSKKILLTNMVIQKDDIISIIIN